MNKVLKQAALADLKSAPESGDRSKNGTTLKRLTGKIFLMAAMLIMTVFSSCSKDDDSNPLLGSWLFHSSNAIFYIDGESFNLKELGGDMESFDSEIRGWVCEFAASQMIMKMAGHAPSSFPYTVSGNTITMKDGSTNIIWKFAVSGKSLELILSRAAMELALGVVEEEFYEFDEIDFILKFTRVE